MTKHRDRMTAQGKETQTMRVMRVMRERKEKMELEELKKLEQEENKVVETSDLNRFENIVRMSNRYSHHDLLKMWGQSVLPYMKIESSIDFAFAAMLAFMNEMQKEIEEIKQCLKTKKDIPPHERPITMSIFTKEKQEDE